MKWVIVLGHGNESKYCQKQTQIVQYRWYEDEAPNQFVWFLIFGIARFLQKNWIYFAEPLGLQWLDWTN